MSQSAVPSNGGATMALHSTAGFGASALGLGERAWLWTQRADLRVPRDGLQRSPYWGDKHALELHADPAKLLPLDQAVLSRRAMQQHEAGREPVGIRQIETGAACRQIDDRAADGRAVGSDDDGPGLRYQAGGPDTGVPAAILRSRGRRHGGA